MNVVSSYRIDRQKDTRRQIESNDPELGKLTIDYYNYYPHDGNWERDGLGIGRNTHIKELHFASHLHSVVDRGQFEAFCRGLACNKSIEELSTWCSKLFGGEIFNNLTQFFEQNSNLHRLSVGNFGNAPNSVRLLSESLTKFSSLQEFECRCSKLRDNDIELLLQTLVGHSQLAKIDLTRNEVGGRGMAALAAMLVNPNSSLDDLVLEGCSLDDEGAVAFADALGRNSTLKKLNLDDNSNITATGWNAIFTQLQSPQPPLEDLVLYGNSIDDAAANLLGKALDSLSRLKVLKLGSNYDITTEGWQAIFDTLQSPRCMLQELVLFENGFTDEVVTHLSHSLANNCVLRHLDPSVNSEVTSSGWREFSAVLQNPNSALEKVDLGYNSIDDDALISFATSLVHNSKLKELILDEDSYEDINITIVGWAALSNVLCNKMSINATFNSNHTLQGIFDNKELDEPKLPSDLRALLQLNRENTKIEAARRKVIDVHFSGAFNMQPFVDMNVKEVPHAIAWMARDEHGSSLMYKFVRNTTFFLNVTNVGGGGTGPAANEPESKRQKL